MKKKSFFLNHAKSNKDVSILFFSDTQAMVLMALSCARNQTDSTVNNDLISELALELKQRQYQNGTVENLHNTLLVMQVSQPCQI